MNEQEIFIAALEIEDLQQRAAYLDQVCGEDRQLREQVAALLNETEQSGEFLGVPVLEQMRRSSEATRVAGEDAGAQPGLNDLDLGFLQPATEAGSLGVLGHYDIQDLIGRGGCGIVFKAFDQRLHRIVAIKVMTPAMAATSPARKRFLREARATAAIRHENVVNIYAVEEAPLPFLVMEYIDGKTLQQVIDDNGPLDLTTIVKFGRMIADGLEAAHLQGLIHRDIKPGNILIESGTGRVKITDFGLARAADDASRSQSGIIAGTPMYMSPEQVQGLKLDRKSDLFSLGSVLYVMCSGRPPFRAPSTLAVLKRVVDEEPRSIREIIPEVPDWLVAIIRQLHEKDPDHRFQSAQDVAERLAGGAEAAVPMRQTRDESTSAKSKKLRQSRLSWMKVVAILIVLLSSFGFTEATGITRMHSTVIRYFSPEGTLVIEVEDPGVSVSIDGQELVIKGAGVEELRLKPGQYQFEATKGGEVLKRELVTVTRDGREVVRVSREVPLSAAPTKRSTTEVSLPDQFENQLGMNFIKVPAGSAYLGGYGGLAGWEHVSFSQDIYMGACEVTQREWLAVVGKNHSHFSAEGAGKAAIASLSVEQQGDLPVESVSCFDIQYFIDVLNDKYADQGWIYRLPTRVEWEYACRGGPRGTYSNGSHDFYLNKPVDQLLTGEANIDFGLNRTQEVGSYSANRLGLHDMHGNVSEWCLGVKTPEGQQEYVQCGGSWQQSSNRCRAIDYRKEPPGLVSIKAGFRLVRVRADMPPPEIRIEIPPEQRSSLEWVVLHGGNVTVFVGDQRVEVSPGGTLPEEITFLHAVDLKGIRLLNAENVENLRNTPRVRNAVFVGASVDDLVFARLMSFPGITYLSNLNAEGASISDQAVAELRHLTDHFFGLILSETKISAEGLKQMRYLSNHGVLLKECRNIDDAACRVLAETPRWVWLGLSGTRVTDAGLEELHVCKKLVAIDVVRCPVTEGGVRKLAAALPRCRIEWDGGFIEPVSGK